MTPKIHDFLPSHSWKNRNQKRKTWEDEKESVRLTGTFLSTNSFFYCNGFNPWHDLPRCCKHGSCTCRSQIHFFQNCWLQEPQKPETSSSMPLVLENFFLARNLQMVKSTDNQRESGVRKAVRIWYCVSSQFPQLMPGLLLKISGETDVYDGWSNADNGSSVLSVSLAQCAPEQLERGNEAKRAFTNLMHDWKSSSTTSLSLGE